MQEAGAALAGPGLARTPWLAVALAGPADRTRLAQWSVTLWWVTPRSVTLWSSTSRIRGRCR
jgi:hypothetical protein